MLDGTNTGRTSPIKRHFGHKCWWEALTRTPWHMGSIGAIWFWLAPRNAVTRQRLRRIIREGHVIAIVIDAEC